MAEGNPVNRNDSARQRRRDRHNIADTTEKYSVHAANEPARFSGAAKMNVPGLGVGETNTKQSHDEYEGTDTTDMMHNRLGASSTASSTSHEVVIKVMYHVREDTDWIQYIDYTCTCDLQQYCKWSFICKSVEHFKRCNTELATPGTAAIALGVSLSGQSCPCIGIHDGVESEHHAMQVAEQVFQYAVEVYGSAVTVLPVNSDQYNTLKNTFELADSIYAHLVQDDVYCLVYDTKYDQKLRHLLDHTRPKSKNQVITTCIKMPIIFSKFEAKINMLVRKNHNVELLCEMTPDTAMYKCVITGQDADVTGAEATINEFLRSIKTEDARSRIPSVVPERLLDNLQVDVELDDILKTRDIDCVTETQGRKWLVYGYDDAEINRACYIIGKHIICKTISFAGLHNTQFNDSVAEITEQFKHQVAVHLDKTLIYIAGLKSCVDETVNAIKNSAIGAPDKRDLNKSANSASGERDNKISADSKTGKRDINTSLDSGTDRNDMNRPLEGKDANTAIEVHDRSCKTFILSKNGQQFVDLIERNYGVNIDIIEYTDDANTLHPKRPECVRHEHGSDGTSCWEFANTKQLKVCSRDGDQTGAAPVFTWRMKGDTLRFHPVEGARVTNAGRPSKFVIELPDSHTDLARLRQILEDALQYIYTEVQVLELHTIAVSLEPVGQWTALEFSECLIKEVVDIIMGLDATHVHHETLLYTTDETQLNKLLNVTATHLETIGKESGSSMVEEGLLDQTKADVIVNTTSANLDLGQGVVSRALLKAAGPQMQKECHRSYPKGVSRGEIAITAGYNLRCRYVIHVALPVYKDAVAMECIQVVKTLMSKCLKWASGKGMRTIAFPAFGTGKLKYPATIVAGEMLNSIERFKRETSKHSVPHAKFVIYPKDKDILEIFKTLESSLRKQRVSKSSLKLQIAGRKNNIHSAVVEIQKKLNLVPEHVDPEAPFTSYIQMGNTDYAALWILFKPDLEAHADMTIKHGTKDGEQCMTITGKRSDVDLYVEHITELIRKVNCMKKERLPVQVPIPGAVLYEQQRQQDVCCVYDQIHQLLTIYAPTRELLANTKTTLQKYLKLDMQVCSSHTTAESSRMSEWGGPAQKDAAKHMANSNSRRTHKSFAMNKEVVNLQIFSTGGLQVVVYEGDILQQPVDCIVNAANEDLIHGAGIAYTIAKAAGQALQEESRSIIKSRGQLAVADVVETSAGNLGYRFVLHAVGPCWHDYKPHDLDNGQRCLNDLEITVLNCFRTAERLGLRSIAVPSVSSGVFAVPRELCAVQYAKAILTFGTLCQSLQEIHFIDIDTQMIRLIQEVFNKMITRARPAPYHLKQFIQTPSNGTTPSLSNDRADPVSSESYIENTVVPSGSKEDDCVICMDEMTNAKSLKCGHKFCKECIESYFKVKPACPTCGAVCGVILGDQPDGSMTVGKIRTALCGYEGFDTITITYRFPPGTQSTDHPCPGTPYDGISRTAYLPDSDAGRLVCVMMMLAFERRLVFTIGTSRTTGQEGVITWNDVHHKTYLEPNRQFGYPDATYLQRVTDELAAKGVEAPDIDKKVLKTLATPASKMKPLTVKS